MCQQLLILNWNLKKIEIKFVEKQFFFIYLKVCSSVHAKVLGFLLFVIIIIILFIFRLEYKHK